MAVQVNRHPSTVIIIDGEPFFLARDPKTQAPQWQSAMVATQEGDPTVPQRKRFMDWSRGMGDSRGAIDGAVEYAENAYLGANGRILPGPLITEITTSLDGDIQTFCEVTAPANRILAGGGTKVVEIDPSTMTVSTTNTLAGSVMSMCLFIDQVAIALGDSQQFYRRSAAGAYSASTVTSDANGDYRYARCFGIGANGDLVRGRDYKWSVCSAADFYGTNGNWSAEYPIGDPTGKVNQVFGHNRWDYVLKDEGLYTFDQSTSKEANALTDMKVWKSSLNRWASPWHDLLMVCTQAGLYRFIQQGASRPVGIETIPINEGELSNVYPTAFTAFGEWGYVAYYKPSTGVTYVCMVRRAKTGDAGFGSPFVVVSVIDKFTGDCGAMWQSRQPGTPTVLYAKDAYIRYFQVSREGLPVQYRTSGTVTVRFAPSDLGSPFTTKYFRSVEAILRNPGASQAIQWAAAMDGGSSNNVGSTITSLSGNNERFWTLGANDSGKVVQLIATLGCNSAAAPAEIRDVMLNYEERPARIEAALFSVRLRDFDSEGDIASRKTAAELLSFVDTRCSGSPVQVTDRDGNTYKAVLSRFSTAYQHYTGQTDWVYRGETAQDTLQLVLRKVAYS